MNSIYAKTASDLTIIHCRPDQNYTDTEALEAAINAAATDASTTVVAYACAREDLVAAACSEPGEYNTKIKVAQKQDVPEGKSIILPEGVILADVPAEGYVVYIN